MIARLLLLATLVNHAASFTKSDGVIELKNVAEFNKAVDEFDLLVVEFYAPWCKACQKLAPTYSAAADIMAKFDTPIATARMDITVPENQKLQTEYFVKGTPSLMIFKNQVPGRYIGGVNETSMPAYMKSLQESQVPVLAGFDDVEALQASRQLAFVGFFENADGPEMKALQKEAFRHHGMMSDIAFGVCTDKGVADQFGAEVPGLVLFRQDKEQLALTKDITVPAALKKFVDSSTHAVIQVLTKKNTKQVFAHPIMRHLLLFINKDAPYAADIDNTAKAIANKFPGKIAITKIYHKSDMTAYFGFQDKCDEEPRAMVIDFYTKAMRKFKYKLGKVSEDGLKEFVTEYLAENLSVQVKSDPVPESNDGPVFEAVGETWEKMVMKSEQNVLVDIYAPWCGRCKTLEPEFEFAARHYAGNDKVKFVKFNPTTNDFKAQGLKIEAYPTIAMFPADKTQSPRLMLQHKDAAGIREFLHEFHIEPVAAPVVEEVPEAKKEVPEANTEHEL